MAGEGLDEENTLREGGASEEMISQWKDDTRRTLVEGGAEPKVIDEYFGVKNPDMGSTKKYFEKNLAALKAEKAEKVSTTSAVPQKQAHPADGFIELMEAGWQSSVLGLMVRGQAPDVLKPEHAGMFANIASAIPQLAGDMPAMVLGAAMGGNVGAAGGALAGAGASGPAGVGPGAAIGRVVGSGAGAFALPAAMRQILMDHYEKGDIKDFSDFYERASATLWEATKQGTVGALTSGVGAGVSTLVSGTAAKAVLPVAAEIATMTAAGKAVEGEIPSAQDFIEGAILVGGLHGAGHVAGKLRNIYKATGEKPSQIALRAEDDPFTNQELTTSSAVEVLGGKTIDIAPAAKAEADAVAKIEEPKTANEKILAQVGEQGEKPSAKLSFNKLYQDFVDVHDPIKRAVEELTAKKGNTLPADQNPYFLARQAVDHGSKTQHFIEKGTLDFNTREVNGKGLLQIVEPFKEDINGFKGYVISKRALEIEGRGLVSGFDKEAATQVVKEGAAKYDDAAKELTAFQNRVLQYAKDSGIVSKESFKAMKLAGEAYLPFSRIFSDEELSSNGKQKAGAGSLKALLGSEKKIQDPFQSVLENTGKLIEMSEKNRAKVSFVELAEKNDSDMLEKVKTPIQKIAVNAKEVEKLFGQLGITDVEPEGFDIFRGRRKDLADDEFQIMRDGKREVYKVDPMLATSMQAIEGNAPITNMAFRLARAITTTKKIGLTLTPEFLVKNAIRDFFTASAFSEKFLSPMDIGKSMGDLIGHNDTYYNWLKSGGANGSFVDIGKKYNDVFKLNEETGFIDRTWNVLKTPVEMLAVAGQLVEQATRLAEFKNVKGENNSAASLVKAGMASREITVDFLRMGAKVSAFNAITAFQNVSIQGLDRAARAVNESPKAVVGKSLAMITAPSILLWYANKDEKWYQEIERWEKDLFWHFRVKEHTYRIPKPQELGLVFGTLPVRLLETFFTENPNALKDFEKTITSLVVPSLSPDIATAPIEQWANKSFFTDRKLIPARLEGVAPKYQYNDYTTESAKMIGNAIGAITPIFTGKHRPGESTLASPLIVENYVRSWGGTQGVYALQMADKAMELMGINPNKPLPPAKLSDIPFVKAFVSRDPSAGAQSIEDFHNNYAEAKEFKDTLKLLAAKMQFKDYEKEIMNPETKHLIVDLEGIQQGLNNQSALISKIYNMPYEALDNTGKGKEVKGQKIDSLLNQMIDMARAGNAAFAKVKKEMKADEQRLKR